MLMRGMILALALLILPLSGMASAEQSVSATDASQKDELELFGANAVYIDSDTDLTALDEEDRAALELAGIDVDSEWSDLVELNIHDIAPVDDSDVANVVVIVYTDGEVAWIVVVVIYEDGSTDVNRYGPMRYSTMRERLANFDGRIVVHWVDFDLGDDSDDETGCAGGLLAGQWTANDDGQGGLFRGLLMNSDGETIGHMSGQYNAGGFRGEWTARGGSLEGTLGGTYANGTFHGQWAASDSDLEGLLRGHYLSTGTGIGVFRGQWVVDCNNDGGIDPVPTPHRVCKKVQVKVEIRDLTTDARNESATTTIVTRVICIQAISHGSDSVGISPVPTPIPHPQPIDDVKERPPVDIIVPDYKEGDDLSDLMDKPLLETESGTVVDLGDAAAGSTLGTITLLGAGLLRRRLTGGI
ncbi:MAG TPA: hypothetical protein EYQ80_02010 [Candidatus Poseidoniales archaeon]|nr:hypothetical protein [Candidatus Poseidoniales archaeon]